MDRLIWCLFWAVLGVGFALLRQHERNRPRCICHLQTWGTHPCQPSYGGGSNVWCPCYCHQFTVDLDWGQRYAQRNPKTGLYQ